MNYGTVEASYDSFRSPMIRYIASFVYQFLCAIAGREMEISVAALLLFGLFLYLREFRQWHRGLTGGWVAAGLLALGYMTGLVFHGGVDVSSTIFQIVKGLTGWVGWTVFYHTGLCVLWRIRKLDLPRFTGLWEKAARAAGKHPFWFAFCVMSLFWVIPLITKYPSGLCYDVRFQLDQALGNTPLTAHHPIMHTVLLGAFVRFGQMLGSANMGLFLFVTVEMLAFAVVVGYGMCFLQRIRAARWAKLVYLGFFALSPFVIGYIGAPIKDVYFSVFSLLYTISVAQYVLEEDFWKNWKKPAVMLLAALGMVLSRNNGSYVIALSILAILVFDRRRLSRHWRRIAVLVLVVALPMGTTKVLEGIYQPEAGSLVEALSLPLQQTARLVRDHEEVITEEERAIIDRVVDYDQLAEVYDPYISDPVKGLYRNPDTGELMDYFMVWLKQFFRQPGCYVAATVHQNILLLYPGYTNFTYYSGPAEAGYPSPFGNLFYAPQWLSDVQLLTDYILAALHKAPLLYLLNNMSSYVLALFVIAYFFGLRRDWRNLLYLVPAFGALLVVLLAPCVMMNARYTFPVIYVIPVYLGCFTAPGSNTHRIQ